jgi:hypothetical protein
MGDGTIRQINFLSRKIATLKKNLFMTVGRNKTNNFFSHLDNLVSILEQRNYKDFSMTSCKDSGKDHDAV